LRLADLDRLAASSPTILAESVAGSSGRLALEADGSAWAVWDSPSVSAVRISAAGSAGAADTLGQASRSGARLGVSADGSVMVVFPAKVGSAFTIVARRFSPGNGWSDATVLDTEGYKGTTSVSGADVAVDPAGNALVLWTTSMTYVVSQTGSSTTYDTISELRGQRFSVTQGWAGAHETLDIGATSEQALVLDDSGNGFAVGVVVGAVRGARWLADSGWQPSTLLGDAPPQGVGVNTQPRIAVDRSGRAAALWRSGRTLIIRRFDGH
jgi:hypothetical protein